MFDYYLEEWWLQAWSRDDQMALRNINGALLILNYSCNTLYTHTDHCVSEGNQVARVVRSWLAILFD